MAMTKRGRVAFDFKYVIDSETEADLMKQLVGLSRKVLEGTADGLEREYVRAALEGGLEATVELMVKQGLQKLIKAEVATEGVTVSNVRVTV